MEFFKLSSLKLVISTIFLMILCGCSMLNPYIDRRRNPGTQDISQLYSGPSKPDAPVVCYNGLWSSDEDLQELATAECIKHGTGDYAEFQEKTHLDGKLLLPSHAHYKCVNKKGIENESSTGK